jgi:hypothetical protein
VGELLGFLALRRSHVAAADRRSGDVSAPLDYARELAARTGEGHAYGLGFGPSQCEAGPSRRSGPG